MSDTQFKIYESARKQEREIESNQKPKSGSSELFEEKASTYRIFSRLFCNFVMPDRPIPMRNKKKEEKEEEKEEKEEKEMPEMAQLIKEGTRIESKQDVQDDREGEIEGDEILDAIGGVNYKERLDIAIKNIEEHSSDFLTPEALETYSPKFLHMLENITDPEHQGLHLVYSQFRTAEGIGIFSLVLEKNGFARFRIKKNNLNIWEIDIREGDEGKPTYALYTGTETSEEKEMLRHIYNGEWNQIPESIGSVLKSKYHNNNIGEVIKVFMITSSGSEGINLRNTRYVHIMEPYWHPVRSEQVIGRARRICSHKDLPKALQTVEVFVYLMIFSESQLKSDEAIELKRKDLSKDFLLQATNIFLKYLKLKPI
jgi:SNF2 family DNA or RNA helicase